MASLKIQDGVVFLLLIQTILGSTVSTNGAGAWSPISPIRPISTPSSPSANVLKYKRIISQRTKALAESDFLSDTKLRQVLGNFSTDYYWILDGFRDFENNSTGGLLGPLVISRKSIDTGQSLLVLNGKEDGLELDLGLESGVFLVLKRAGDSGTQESEYFASLVYLRTEGRLHLEWDTWIPRLSSKRGFRMSNGIDLQGQGQTDLLDQTVQALTNTLGFCHEKSELRKAHKIHRIRKRGLLDGWPGMFRSLPVMQYPPPRPVPPPFPLPMPGPGQVPNSNMEPIPQTTPVPELIELLESKITKSVDTEEPKPVKSEVTTEEPYRPVAKIYQNPFTTAIDAGKVKTQSASTDDANANILPKNDEKDALKMSTERPPPTSSQPPDPVVRKAPYSTKSNQAKGPVSKPASSPPVPKKPVAARPVSKRTGPQPGPRPGAKAKPVPKTPEPRSLLSNRIYLVKPDWYPSAVVPPKPQGRGFSANKKSGPIGTNVIKAFPATKGISLKKGTAVSNAQTNVGKAVATAQSKQGGTAVANAEVKVKGNAFASTRSLGGGQFDDGSKIALSNANTVQGGMAVAKAESDGYNPILDDGRTHLVHRDEAAEPSAIDLIKETDKEFRSVFALSTKTKRSIRTPTKKRTENCQNLANFYEDLGRSDKMFLSKYNFQTGNPKFKYGSNDLNFQDYYNQDVQKPVVHKPAAKDSGCLNSITKESNEVLEILKVLDLECNAYAQSYITNLETGSAKIRNGVLKLTSAYPILKKQKLSPEEIRNLTALVVISSYTSALRKLTEIQNNLAYKPDKEKNGLLAWTILQAIHTSNQPTFRNHQIKISNGIVKLLDAILIQAVQNARECSKSNTNEFSSDYTIQELLTLSRFSQLNQSGYLRFLKPLNSVEDLAKLYRKYHDYSHPATKRLSNCLLHNDLN